MKTKLEMAHEWAMKIIEGNVRAADASDLLDRAWQYADAMQVEADKRTTKCDEKIEINMYPEWDASINYPPDAWVMYRGEKRLAISIKEEWQSDWSQAPEWANFIVMSKAGTSYWHANEPKASGNGWVGGGLCDLAYMDFYHKGDWRDSLRKRPE